MSRLFRRTPAIDPARLSWLTDTLQAQGLVANATTVVWKD